MKGVLLLKSIVCVVVDPAHNNRFVGPPVLVYDGLTLLRRINDWRVKDYGVIVFPPMSAECLEALTSVVCRTIAQEALHLEGGADNAQV